MPAAQELPQLVSELATMSKDYLLQETVEPAKRLGKHAGLGVAAGVVLALGALFLALGAYAALKFFLPGGDWWLVLARGLTVVVSGTMAGVVAWRMTS